MTKYSLRPYQQEAVDKSVAFLTKKKGENGIIVLPTGSGKSLVIAAIAKALGEPTLIFSPTKEILEQNLEKLASYGEYASVYSASMGQRRLSNITLATIGSVKNRADIFAGFQYVLIDECHLVNAKGGMYSDFIKKQDGSVLGLTATPYRLTTDGFGGSILKFLTRTRPRIFSHLIYYVQIGQLFNEGHLARLRYFTNAEFDRSKLRLNSTGADFADASIQQYYTASGFKDKIAEQVKDILRYRKNCLVFTRFIEESEYLVNNIPGTAIVTGKTPKKERERLITDFRKGIIKAICNVGVLTTGFDYPELETVVLARPTMSLALYYQMVGRGIRPHPNKDFTAVIDMCGNHELFGKVEDLQIINGGGGKWFIASNGRQLTNVYYGERTQ